MPEKLEADIIRVAATQNPLVAGDLGVDATGRHSGFINGVVTPYATAGAVGSATDSVPIIWESNPADSASEILFTGGISAFELKNNSVKGVLTTIHLPLEIDLTIAPVLRIPLAVSAIGVGGANADFSLACHYISSGDLVTQVADEVVPQSLAIINTLNRVHFLNITLNPSLITAGDVVKFIFNRTVADPYSGNLGALKLGSQLRFRRL